MYHFPVRFTSSRWQPERLTSQKPTFHLLWPLHAAVGSEVYGQAVARKSRTPRAPTCWFVNTGWTRRGLRTGSRMPIKHPRAADRRNFDEQLG